MRTMNENKGNFFGVDEILALTNIKESIIKNENFVVVPADGEFVIDNDILFFKANTTIKKTLYIPISSKSEDSKVLFDNIDNIKGRLVYINDRLDMFMTIQENEEDANKELDYIEFQIYLDYLNIDNKDDFINLIIDKK